MSGQHGTGPAGEPIINGRGLVAALLFGLGLVLTAGSIVALLISSTGGYGWLAAGAGVVAAGGVGLVVIGAIRMYRSIVPRQQDRGQR